MYSSSKIICTKKLCTVLQKLHFSCNKRNTELSVEYKWIINIIVLGRKKIRTYVRRQINYISYLMDSVTMKIKTQQGDIYQN